MRKPLIVSLILILFYGSSCSNSTFRNRSQQTVPPRVATSHNESEHPDWIMQGNIYEVNVRQYTPEGTFKAFQKHLDRLRNMGVQTLWFMPIHPISKVDRKGTLGSYYAVADYTAINPEFGTLEDWKELVDAAHKKGFKVIIDWVANHTGADHKWLTSFPHFFEKDSTGKPVSAFDWTDTRSLNFSNREMQDSMIGAMKFWVKETDIDGFRCDVAGEVPEEFWEDCIKILRRQKNVFMLAEAEKPSLLKAGFDATYGWDMFSTMKDVAKGSKTATALDDVRLKYKNNYQLNAMFLLFTSNHDENSWNKADYETMPGAVHAPFAVLTQTMQGSIPLVYSGQEEPVLRRIEFFEKDPMNFGKYERAKFYRTLMELRKNNPALSAHASFQKVSVANDDEVYAFSRQRDGKKVFVIVNLSAKEQSIEVHDPNLLGNTFNVFKGAKEVLTNKPWKLAPWGYAVYEYK